MIFKSKKEDEEKVFSNEITPTEATYSEEKKPRSPSVKETLKVLKEAINSVGKSAIEEGDLFMLAKLLDLSKQVTQICDSVCTSEIKKLPNDNND